MLRYAVVPLSQVTERMLNNSINRKIEDLRLSLNGNYCIIKFEAEDILSRQAFQDYPQYLPSEIHTVLENGQW